MHFLGDKRGKCEGIPARYVICEKLNKALNSTKDFTWHYLYIFHYLKTYKFINSKFKDEEYIPVNIKKLRTVISYDKASKLLKDLVD